MVPNLFDKEKYVLHYENLELYLKLGLELKIHRALEFNQSQWLKLYVKFNTQKKYRKNGGKDEKALYKLMNRAAYGKTMENVCNNIVVKLVNNEKDCLKWASKPSYMSQKIFDKDLVVM